MPQSGWWVARQSLFLMAVPCTIFFGTIFFVVGYQQRGIVGGLIGLLISQIMILPMAMLYAAAASWAFRRQRPTTTVRDGQIHVRSGKEVCSYDLGKCEWFIGSVRYAFALVGGQAVIIALPGERGEQEKFAAVGCTPESRVLWQRFLTIAKLPRRTAWENRSRVRCNALAAILGLPLCVGGCALLAWLGLRAMLWLNVQRDIAGTLALLVFLPGSIYAFVYLAVLWPWYPLSPTKVEIPRDQLLRLRLRIYGSVGAMTMTILFGLWTSGQSREAHIAGTIPLVLSALVVAYDLGNRYARRAWRGYRVS